MEKELSVSGQIIGICPPDIKNCIFTIRDTQIMLDTDLANLYEVEAKNLNRAVKRNENRLPLSFRFQLTEQEYEFINSLRCQIGTLKKKFRF